MTSSELISAQRRFPIQPAHVVYEGQSETVTARSKRSLLRKPAGNKTSQTHRHANRLFAGADMTAFGIFIICFFGNPARFGDWDCTRINYNLILNE